VGEVGVVGAEAEEAVGMAAGDSGVGVGRRLTTRPLVGNCGGSSIAWAVAFVQSAAVCGPLSSRNAARRKLAGPVERRFVDLTFNDAAAHGQIEFSSIVIESRGSSDCRRRSARSVPVCGPTSPCKIITPGRRRRTNRSKPRSLTIDHR